MTGSRNRAPFIRGPQLSGKGDLGGGSVTPLDGELGKKIGDDLAEGKPTLPLIFALLRGSPRQQLMIRRAIENGGLEEINAIQAAIQSTGALAYTVAKAREYKKAPTSTLASLPNTLLAVSWPRRRSEASTTSSCSRVAVWMNSMIAAVVMCRSP